MSVCIFCSCTDDQACVLPIERTVDQRVEDALEEEAYGETGHLPQYVGCSWISIDPPVCSAPTCRKAFARQLAEVD